MFPVDHQSKRPVAVWCDNPGGRSGRVCKVFEDPCAARRFYAAKLKAGRNPTVGKVPPPGNSGGT